MAATTTTHYLRDASGNVMAIYKDTQLAEQPIYGISRLGQYTGRPEPGKRILQRKKYELSNHLGNVLAVVGDGYTTTSGDKKAWISSLQDYYSFGLAMEGRSSNLVDYRYGFNGKERDPATEWGQTSYDYGFRIYNPGIGKFLSVDPLTSSYPFYSPYHFAGNNPIKFIDLDGLEQVDPSEIKQLLNGKTKIDMSAAPSKYQTASGRWVYTTTNALGEKRNHAWYWAQVLKNSPEMFDKENIAKIKQGKAPFVNEKWIEHNKSHAKWRGQKLEHHHKNHGKNAFALPWKAHRGKGNYKLFHSTIKKANKASKSSVLMIFPIFSPSEWSGYFSNRPSSFIMHLESWISPKVGVVYEADDALPGKYFIIREKYERKDDDGNLKSTKYVIDYYDRLEDGYQELDEDSFIEQQEINVSKDGKIIS